MSNVKRISSLFAGLRSAHGVFYPERFEGKKQIGKATTVREDVTEQLWFSHLEGKIGLGIIPINEDSECKWGVIDIDDYDLDFVELLNKIKNTPLVCCRSKSGGAHLFVFTSVFVPSPVIRNYLRNTVGNLGLGRSEIFPKQDKIYAERGDVGNWLNMPYFGDLRRCIINNSEIKELILEEFLDYAESKQVSSEFFDKADDIDYEKSPIDGGPPCLQVMSIVGFPEHTRNVVLFNVGVYCKKAYPDKWKAMVIQFNEKLFIGKKLHDREVEVIIKSLDKKEYGYQCGEEPLCSFCNAKLCRTRRWGISNVAGMPIINSVTKVSGDMSMWFIDVEGGRLELTTEELYDNRRFIMKCLNDLNILPARMRPEKWSIYVQDLVDKAIEIRDDKMFQRFEITDHFKNFIIARLSKNQGDIMTNRVWYDKEHQEVRFKWEAFLDYLKYRKITPNKATIIMYFKSRNNKIGVSKDKLRRSFRYMSVRCTDEEIMAMEEKEQTNEVI